MSKPSVYSTDPEVGNRQSQISTGSAYGAYSNKGFYGSNLSVGADSRDTGLHHEKAKAKNVQPTRTASDSDTYEKKCACSRCCIIAAVVISVLLIGGLIAFLVVWFVVLPNNSTTPSPTQVVSTITSSVLPNQNTTTPVPTQPSPVSDLFEVTLTINNSWTEQLTDKNSTKYKTMSADLVKMFDGIFQKSYMSSYYEESTISKYSPGSIKAFLHLKLAKVRVLTNVKEVITSGLKRHKTSGTLPYVIDETIVIIVVSLPTTQGSTWPSFTDPPRIRSSPHTGRCEALEIEKCKEFGYNITGLPNIIGRNKQSDSRSSFNHFISTGETGCYQHAAFFSCSFLYPRCHSGVVKSACRSFCNDFQQSCKLPFEGCAKLYDDDDPNICILSPVKETEQIPNPPIKSCGSDHFWCGDRKTCVTLGHRCDGKHDCPDSSDEVDCPNSASQLDCNFEGGNLCSFTQSQEDDFDWMIFKGSTPSLHTGPHWDHTHMTSQGSYLLMEASGRFWNDKAVISSPLVDLSYDHCLRFYYSMSGAQVDSLKVLIEYNKNSKSVMLRKFGDHGDGWRSTEVSLPPGQYKVLFQATRGEGYRGDVGLDDISLRPGQCLNEVCLDDEYRCQNGHCVLKEYTCNGLNECGDYSDEQDCVCEAAQFQCQMGLCINSHLRCDGKFQCPDNSDELNCVCPSGQHQCPNGHCIMREWLCDRQQDCSDGSDENECGFCQADQFQCHDFTCVNKSQRCDGQKQCSDESDELDCVKVVGSESVIQVEKGDTWLPICSSSITDTVADEICKHQGYWERLQRGDKSMSSSGGYLSLGSGSGSFLARFTTVSSCSGNNVLTLTCKKFECGHPGNVPSSYIVNGVDALPGEWPWHAALYNGLFYLCGGTLLSTHHVITAAHCLDDVQHGNVDLGNIYVKLGLHRIDQNTQIRQVKKYLIHENYQLDRYYWGHDLAVLILHQEVAFSNIIKPACLPEQEHFFHWTTLCYTSGFGYINKTTETLPDVLQKAKMKLWENEHCNQGYHGTIQDNMVCAGYSSGHITNCIGDSGGPLVCKTTRSGPWFLTGVFSFVPDQCQDVNRPSVFGRVQSFLPWIKQKLECVFRCDNNKCLYAEEDLCNGVDDCGDKTDETKPCSPTVQCDFEHPYQCGYYSLASSGRWHRGQVVEYTDLNVGPTVDHTFANNSGHFMYTDSTSAALVSPVFQKTTQICLTFHYHMRGSSVGKLTLRRHTVTLPFNNNQIQLNTGTELFEKTGHQGDIWRKHTMTLQAGTFVLTFEASKSQSDSNRIAIDDVQIRSGDCNFLACIDNTFKCDSIMCYPRDNMCDFKEDCIDFSDELVCLDRRYECDFEAFGRCRLEQSHSDSMDWEIINHNQEPDNSPLKDHSHASALGHFGYLNTAYPSGTGEQARLTFNIGTLTTEACFVMYYSMKSNSSLSINVVMGQNTQLKWRVSRQNTANWTEVEVALDPGVKSVKIDAVVGPWVSGSNFIAIDDVRIISGKCKSAGCQEGQIQCSNGQCISASFWCNGIDECGDRSDEPHGCSCRDEQYECYNGLCIPGYKYCDGTVDCGDSSDELNGCTCASPWTFKCTGKEQCIRLEQVCNGWNDCGDNSDENNCSCSGYRCADGTCIRKSQFCDGSPDCPQSDDEPPNCQCLENGFKCAAGNCISSNKVCDGEANCNDLSDETNCTCPDNFFHCDNNRCIPPSKRCDGFNDCGDVSDERGCACQENHKACNNGICVYKDYWCDGQDDCGDESDEAHCACRPGTEIQCGHNGSCIEKTWKCDGNNDCADGSDEVGCNSCSSSQFQCNDYTCVADTARCNGVTECSDQSDEQGCVKFLKVNPYIDVVEIKKNSNWYPVCYTNWQQRWSDKLCTLAGQRRAIVTHYTAASVSNYLTVAPGSSGLNYSHALLSLSSSCSGNNVVKITCEEEVCGTRSSNLTFATQYIIGGEVAFPGAWPWTVSLQYLGKHWCGGVLIDSQWVLTAAHCFYYNNVRSMTSLLQYFKVLVGTNNQVDNSGQQIGVSAVYLHPQHVLRDLKFDDNDIALIKLSSDLVMTDYVRTSCMPTESLPSSVYRVCFLTGWGITNKWLDTTAMQLREAKFKIWSHTDCSTPEVWGSDIHQDRMLCAGYQSGNIAACHGDSGSPLVCLDSTDRWNILGLVSHGPSVCGTKPSVLTKTIHYKSWIQSTMQQNK